MSDSEPPTESQPLEIKLAEKTEDAKTVDGEEAKDPSSQNPRVSGFTRANSSFPVMGGGDQQPQRRSKIAMGSSGKGIPIRGKLGNSGEVPVTPSTEGTSAPEDSTIPSPKYQRSTTIDSGGWTKPSARDASTPRKLFANSGENRLAIAIQAISPPEKPVETEQSSSPQPLLSPKAARSATIDVGQSQIFTKPIKVARSHRAPQYTFVSSVLEQDEKNREYLTSKESKEAAKEVPKEKETRKSKRKLEVVAVSLLNPPIIPPPYPPGSIALRRAISEENLKKKAVNLASSDGAPTSVKRLTKDLSDVANVDHATSVVVSAGSFVIVFPGGLKKSWVLDPQRLVLPMIIEQCELRNLDITKIIYQNFEGASLTLTPTTKMADIPHSFFYVLNEHEVGGD